MKRARLIIILLTLLALAFLAFAISHDREPRYQGRTLTQWISKATHAHQYNEREIASHAIKQMAPEAIPLLLKWIQVKDSSAGEKWRDWVNDHPFLHLHIKTAWDLNHNAMEGFRLLGTEGKPAWAELVKLSQSSNAVQRAYSTVSLFETKPPKEIMVPVLVRLRSDPDHDVQMLATSLLRARYPGEEDTTIAPVGRAAPRIW